MTAKMCAVPGCVRAARSRGWCPPHYLRWHRHGDVQAHIPIGRFKKHPDFCPVEGCGLPVRTGRGYCSGHQSRLDRHGDLQPDLPLGWRTQAVESETKGPDPDEVRRVYSNAIDVWRLGSPAWEACHRLGVRPRRVSAWAYDHLPDTDSDKGEVVAAFYAAHHYMPEETDD